MGWVSERLLLLLVIRGMAILLPHQSILPRTVKYSTTLGYSATPPIPPATFLSRPAYYPHLISSHPIQSIGSLACARQVTQLGVASSPQKSLVVVNVNM